MCGRVNVSDNQGVRLLLESLGMKTWPTRDPRFNIAPTQTLDVVRYQDDLELVPMRWGVSMMLPGKNGLVNRSVQNARDDKVWSSRLWKPLMHSQRVLVPVNGFYEWRRENGKPVAAFYITPIKQAAMFFAGIFKESKTLDEKPEVSIITTSANEAMSVVHDRMPVILGAQNAALAWLHEGNQGSLTELMAPAANDTLRITQVSQFVNKSSNEGPDCISPLLG